MGKLNNLSGFGHGERYPALEYLDVMDEVPGWMYPLDARLFVAVDELQKASGISGNLLEIGAYCGKTAILLGFLARAAERTVVCDIFDCLDEVVEENESESIRFYGSLKQADFERYYNQFHEVPALVMAMPSTRLWDAFPPGSFRFVHIDGSHTYEVVRADIRTARRLLGPGGVVVFDDWSTSWAGVGLAIWEEYLRDELIPLCFTRMKFYATWDDSGLKASDIDQWAMARHEIDSTYVHRLRGRAARYLTIDDARESAFRTRIGE